MRFALLLLCGCRQFLGFEELATSDASGDGASQPVCVGSDRGLMGKLCLADIGPPRELSGIVDTSESCDPARTDVCLIAAQSIDVATLRARGSRPLVLWSASTILVRKSAVLDLRSIEGIGAGANDSSCAVNDGSAEESSNPKIGTGGCGGSFGTTGGGAGDGNAVNTATVAIECATGQVSLDRVRGGCPGGRGGLSDVIGAGNGGDSAGAVYLMAADSITIAGVIDARGTAGGGGQAVAEGLAGGGGGGSGGLIGLEAPSIFLDDAVLNALGGGGGSGAGVAAGPRAGNDGKEATLQPPTNAIGAAQTVNTNFGGGTGAPGGSVDVAQSGGGGGGGGGAGYIIVVGEDLQLGSSEIAPPITP